LQIGGGAVGAGGEGGEKLQVILKSINLLSDQAQQPQQQIDCNICAIYMEEIMKRRLKRKVVISLLNGKQLGYASRYRI
jgi:hypothetical protein